MKRERDEGEERQKIDQTSSGTATDGSQMKKGRAEVKEEQPELLESAGGQLVYTAVANRGSLDNGIEREHFVHNLARMVQQSGEIFQGWSLDDFVGTMKAFTNEFLRQAPPELRDVYRQKLSTVNYSDKNLEQSHPSAYGGLGGGGGYVETVAYQNVTVAENQAPRAVVSELGDCGGNGTEDVTTFALLNVHKPDRESLTTGDIIQSLKALYIPACEGDVCLKKSSVWNMYHEKVVDKRSVCVSEFSTSPALATRLNVFLTSPKFLEDVYNWNIKSVGENPGDHFTLIKNPTKSRIGLFSMLRAIATLCHSEGIQARHDIERFEMKTSTAFERINLGQLASGPHREIFQKAFESLPNVTRRIVRNYMREEYQFMMKI